MTDRSTPPDATPPAGRPRRTPWSGPAGLRSPFGPRQADADGAMPARPRLQLPSAPMLNRAIGAALLAATLGLASCQALIAAMS